MDAFLTCHYDDRDPASYAGFIVRTPQREETFNTGNPAHDYLVALFVAFERSHGRPVSESSSIDHFVMDGGTLVDPDDATSEQIDAASEVARLYMRAHP